MKFINLTNLDKKLGILGLFGSLMLLIISTMSLKSLQLQIVSIFTVSVCIIYFFKKRQFTSIEELELVYDIKKSKIIILNILFFGVLTTTLLLWSAGYYSNPIIFLLMASLISGILTVEIFTTNNSKYTVFILAKILFLGILLRAYPYYLFPTQPGVDSMFHAALIGKIMSTGYIDTTTKYGSYPVIHLISASVANVTGLSIKNSFFFISVIAVLGLTFIFLIGKKLFNEKVGLLSVLILAVSASQITLGWWITAMTIGLALIPIIIFLMIPTNNKSKDFKYKLFIFLFMILTIFSHPTPALTVLLIGGGAWILSKVLYKSGDSASRLSIKSSSTLTLLFLTLLFGYWVYKSGFILELGHIISSMVTVDRSLAIDVAPISSSPLNVIINVLPLVMFMSLGVIGFLTIVSNKKATYLPKIHYAFLGVLISAFVFVLYAFKVYEALPGRWTPFAELGLVCVVAVGILTMTYSKINNRRITMISVLIMLFTAIMVINGVSSVVSIVPGVDQPRMALSQSESYSLEDLSPILGNEDTSEKRIYADYYVISWDIYQNNVTYIKNAGKIFLGESQLGNGVLILRKEMLQRPVLITSNVKAQQFKMNASEYDSFIKGAGYNVFYDSGSIKAIKGV